MYLSQQILEQIDGLVQDRRNSSALATKLCLYCTNPSKWSHSKWKTLGGHGIFWRSMTSPCLMMLWLLVALSHQQIWYMCWPWNISWFLPPRWHLNYCKVSNIRCTLVGNYYVNCWSLRCSWSIACQRCSNYIFILNLTSGFNGLGKDNYQMRREAFKFWDLVRLILETLRYTSQNWVISDFLHVWHSAITCFIINWMLSSKLQWHLNQNANQILRKALKVSSSK